MSTRAASSGRSRWNGGEPTPSPCTHQVQQARLLLGNKHGQASIDRRGVEGRRLSVVVPLGQVVLHEVDKADAGSRHLSDLEEGRQDRKFSPCTLVQKAELFQNVMG